MRHEALAAVAVAVLMVFSGAVLSLGSDSVYRYDVTFSQEGDGLSFHFGTNTGAEARAVMLSDSGLFDVDRVVVLIDRGYASLTSVSMQDEMAEDLYDHFDILSDIVYEVADAEGVLEAMSSYGPSSTAVMLVSGSIPDVIHAGHAGSPLLDWLGRGGVVVNVSGCLGKYISHGPDSDDIETVAGYGKLFAAVDDDVFLDLDRRMFADSECNEAVRDALNIYMNEYTYGVVSDSMQDVLDIGYVSEEGQSSAVAYRSGNGMVLNFGSSLFNHVHFDYSIVKVLASGMDYTSEVLETFSGSGDCEGSFAVRSGSFSVYAYFGVPRAVHGECFSD